MKLKTSWLCVECEEIFSAQAICPSCGSKSVMAIGRWLNRTELPEPGPTAIERRKDYVMFSTLREVEA